MWEMPCYFLQLLSSNFLQEFFSWFQYIPPGLKDKRNKVKQIKLVQISPTNFLYASLYFWTPPHHCAIIISITHEIFHEPSSLEIMGRMQRTLQVVVSAAGSKTVSSPWVRGMLGSKWLLSHGSVAQVAGRCFPSLVLRDLSGAGSGSLALETVTAVSGHHVPLEKPTPIPGPWLFAPLFINIFSLLQRFGRVACLDARFGLIIFWWQVLQTRKKMNPFFLFIFPPGARGGGRCRRNVYIFEKIIYGLLSFSEKDL